MKPCGGTLWRRWTRQRKEEEIELAQKSLLAAMASDLRQKRVIPRTELAVETQSSAEVETEDRNLSPVQ
jgi:hypothetical protein